MRGLCAALLVALGLSACDVRFSAKSGDDGLQGGGVKFRVPMESSNSETGPGGIAYQGARFKANTDGRRLWVNGQDFGELRPGDVVDFNGFPEVKVNGEVRRPAGV